MDRLEEQQQQRSEKPIINITGEKVALGPIRRDQVPLFYRWANDFNVLRTLHIPRPSTFEENLAFFERDIEDEKRRHVVHFTVYERTTLTPIGRVDLEEISHRDRRAEFGIEIGEPDYRGRGYGTEATRLMLDYAFTGLGLHNIGLQTWEYNLAAQAVYKKAGFHEVGRRRQAKFMGGKLWDIIYMDCLSTEFVSPVLSKIMVPDEVRS